MLFNLYEDNRKIIIMKVLYFSSDNTMSSGAFRSLVQLAAEEQMKGIECKVILPGHGDGETLLEQKKINYTIIRSYSWIVPVNRMRILAYLCTLCHMAYNMFFAGREVAKLLNEFKPDIVHMNTSWNYVGAREAIGKGIPLVWHIREFLEEDQRRRIIYKRYGYWLISKATKIICISQSIYNKYKVIFPEKNMIYISNGINTYEYLDINHQIFENNNISILCVGQVCKSKGQIDAVRAICKLNNSNIFLKLVGGYKGYYKWYIDKFIRKSDANIEFLGRKSDVRTYYRTTDIFIMSSKAEAWGRVTVEAMMSGCLVIGSDSMGTAEIIQDGETGYLYKQGNVKTLADVISYVLRNKQEAKKIASEGRNIARKKLTAERNAEDVYDVYRKIIKDGSKYC